MKNTFNALGLNPCRMLHTLLLGFSSPFLFPPLVLFEFFVFFLYTVSFFFALFLDAIFFFFLSV